MVAAMLRLASVVSCALALSGCNTFSDYWRRPIDSITVVGPEDLDSPIRGTATDATRRVVIASNTNFSGTDGRPAKYFVCPEPPPDAALSTLSEAILALNARTGDSGELSTSYKAIALALSARTSTVEVWRTTTSAYCVLLMNGRPDEAEALLAASLFALEKTSDIQVVNPMQGDVISTSAEDMKARRARIKEIADQNRADYLRTQLALTGMICDTVPEPERAGHAACKRKAELTALVAQLPKTAQPEASPPADQQAKKEAPKEGAS
jgi:hypothetical protein